MVYFTLHYIDHLDKRFADIRLQLYVLRQYPLHKTWKWYNFRQFPMRVWEDGAWSWLWNTSFHPCVKTKRRLLHWWRDVFPLAFGTVFSVHAALFFEQTPAVHHRNETVKVIARPIFDAEQRVLRVIRQCSIHGRFRP